MTLRFLVCMLGWWLLSSATRLNKVGSVGKVNCSVPDSRGAFETCRRNAL